MKIRLKKYALNILFSISLTFLFPGCKSNDSHSTSLGYQNDERLNNLGIGLVQQINVEKHTELYKDEKLINKLPHTLLFLYFINQIMEYYILYVWKITQVIIKFF